MPLPVMFAEKDAHVANFPHTLSIWIESLIITFIFIITSKLLDNPLSLNSPFPWIWIAPVVIALHYGLLASQLSILLLVGEYLYDHPAQIYTIHFQLFILGGFVLTLICTAWQSSWSKKIIYSDSISDYLQKRIQSTADAYRLTALAYQRLENNYIASPVTIRTSMSALRALIHQQDGDDEAALLNRFINILAMHCAIERAAIFPVRDKKLVPTVITSIGKIKKPSPENFLVKESLDNRKITYIKADELIKGYSNDYLISAPLINQEQIIYAILLVEEIPFLNLNDDNIATMNLLIDYFMEGHAVKGADRITKKFPQCPIVFANEIQRLSHLQHVTKKDSAIEVFILRKSLHQDDYIFRLKQEIRGLDTYWEITKGSVKILLILMPFTNRATVEFYKIRINNLLKQDFNIALNHEDIQFHAYQLSASKDAVHLLEEIFTGVDKLLTQVLTKAGS